MALFSHTGFRSSLGSKVIIPTSRKILSWAFILALLVIPAWSKETPHLVPTVPLKEGYRRADFRDLSAFTLKPKPKKGPPPEETQHYYDIQIPRDVMLLKGEKVQVEGYLFALELDQFTVKTGFLMRDSLGCCFNRPPKIHELIHVTIEKKARQELSMKPVVLWGILEMGDKVMDMSKGGSLYHLHVESMKEVDK